ncbi:MAG: hypothetical protein AB1941_19370 [Gemmatimonadota bacterium]
MREVVMDFVRDWRDAAWYDLDAEGCAPAPDADFEEVCRRFGDLQRRLIPVRPRQVMLARELHCPPHLLDGLDLIRRKIESGENLRAHLSSSVARFDRPDDLLSDWGIHHLHLGTDLRRNGLVERTGPLLFARFTPETAYFINIYDHSSWSKQELIKVLHRNWPETLNEYRLKGVTRSSLNLTDDDMARLRGHQLNAPVEVEPGTVYAMIGGGITASRVAAEVVRRCDKLYDLLHWFEAYVRDCVDDFVAQAEDRGSRFGAELRFRLISAQDGWLAYEEHSQAAMRLPLPDSPD